MAKKISEGALLAIEDAVRWGSGAVSALEIMGRLPLAIPRRTLQYRIEELVSQERLMTEGGGRSTKYRLANGPNSSDPENGQSITVPLSDAAESARAYVRQPLAARRPVGYNRSFLDGYLPNETFYLSEAERSRLDAAGRQFITEQPAGTYAKKILNRLLVDLAWNSSRLEGNTYSLSDTKRLFDFGEEAEGRGNLEAQMILNHRDAIEFLVSFASEIGFNRYTILNLHALLANNLLADPSAAGRLRYITVGVEQSVFHPLETPQIIEEAFNLILDKADAIADPFEQAFFVLAQLPYLQPFDDVNKRVSRLAANIPFLKNNLTPLSFSDVPRQIYTEAVLGVYELNQTDLLKDLFIWAYERSALRYAAVRQSLGEPDPFRLRYRIQLRDIIADMIKSKTRRSGAVRHIAAWAGSRIEPADRSRFIEISETELAGLHEGNFARYHVRPSEFAAWQLVWAEK